MASLDSFPPEILQEIIDKLRHKELATLRQVSTRFYNSIPPFEIETLMVRQLVNKLQISATFPNRQLAQHFFLPHDHAFRTSKRINKETRQVSGFRTFDFPPTSNFALFPAAKIEHLDMDMHTPMILTDANLAHLKNLLTGCVIGRITLAFDHTCLENMHKTPTLVAAVQAKHVDFLMCRIQEPSLKFILKRFGHELVQAGVREITFKGEYKTKLAEQPLRLLELIVRLFDAGIECITVNHGDPGVSLMHSSLTNATLQKLVEKLGKIGKPLRLELNTPPNNTEEKYGVGDIVVGETTVHVRETSIQADPLVRNSFPSHRFNIECTPNERVEQ